MDRRVGAQTLAGGHLRELLSDARQERLRDRHGTILLPLAVTHRENALVEVEQ
jgi:hypothetical protein